MFWKRANDNEKREQEAALAELDTRTLLSAVQDRVAPPLALKVKVPGPASARG